VEEDALERLVQEGYSPAYGARFLKRIIDDRIKLPISEQWRDGTDYLVKLRDGDIVIESTTMPGTSSRERMLCGT
jgi:ATP-dependent Clp protease ATP-binding subunit ClpA